MPEFTVKEVRLPELHLPEIKRDEIVRTFSGVHFPEVDLARVRRARVRLSAIDLSTGDVARLIAGLAVVARFARPGSRRSSWLPFAFGWRSRSPMTRIVRPRRGRRRWRLAIGGVTLAALATWALVSRPAVRERLDEAARRARQRVDALRAGPDWRSDVAADGPSAKAATEAATIDAEGFANATDDAGTGPGATERPDGLGVSDEAGTPAFEESGRPV